MNPTGHHKVIDYLSMSLQLPLYFHPHKVLSQKFTKTIKDIVPEREPIKKLLTSSIAKEADITSMKRLLWRMTEIDFIWNDRYASDFSLEYYFAQGAVTPMLIGHPEANNSLRQ